MRLNVFSKIYLSFLLVVILVSTLQLGYDMITETGPFFGKGHPLMESSLIAYARSTAQYLKAGNRADAQRFLQSLHDDSGVSVLLLGSNGTEVIASTDASDLEGLARNAWQSGTAEADREVWALRMALPVPTDIGEVVIAATFPRPQGNSIWLQHILRLGLLLFVSAGVCFVLAKYLTAPIRSMREATQRFAAGHLDTRMSTLTCRKDEFGALAVDFDSMAVRIGDLLTSQRQLLGDISHELRSPLARLGVALDLLRRGAPQDMEQGLTRIAEESDALNNLIGELLALSRMEQGTGHLSTESVDLAQLLTDVVDDGNFEAQATDRGVVLYHWEPCLVSGDAVLLTRAVENVIRNAIRYAPEQSDVEVRLHRVLVETTSLAEITIRDHGPGVVQEFLSELFEPFFRVSKARERSSGGSGLGLAIARRAVELHGGQIWAENASGGGLLVVIRLPLAA